MCGPTLTNGKSEAADALKIAESHQPTAPSEGSAGGYKKFMPDDLLVVHWFDARSFTRLLRSYVSHGEDMPSGEFLAKFRGFTSRPKASAARRAVPDARKLSDLSDAAVRRSSARCARRLRSRPTGTRGPVGEGTWSGSLRNLYDYDGARAWYKRIKTSLNGAPAVIEAAVVETGSLRAGPALHRPQQYPRLRRPAGRSQYLSYSTQSEMIGGIGIRGS